MISMLLKLPKDMVENHSIPKEYCDSYSKDVITYMKNLLGQEVFLCYSSPITAHYTSSRANIYGVSIEGMNTSHEKYLQRRYNAVCNRFKFIQYHQPVFYDDGNNITLSKQPHKRHINHKRAWKLQEDAEYRWFHNDEI